MNPSDLTELDQPVDTAIIEAVAEKAAVEPTALPPLYEVVDVDAIEALFEPTQSGSPRSGTIRFLYYGYVVTIEFGADGAGAIRVEPADSKQ